MPTILFSTSDGAYRVMVGGMPVMADTTDASRAVTVWQKTIQQNPRYPLAYWDGDKGLELTVTADGEVVGGTR